MPHDAEKLSATEYARLLGIVCPRGSVCWLCRGRRGPIRFDLRARHPLGPSLDHVIPASKGGTWDLWNLRPAHFGCNARRRDRAPSVPRGTRSRRWA
ncbi:HNH endonuclease signature motif containing protein [Microbacterium sp. S16(2024)]|uniref:HNH endonuclease n=1 Tax=Microbacterium sp. S16(2024) TaxID=3368601 RepID=UPI001BB1D397